MAESIGIMVTASTSSTAGVSDTEAGSTGLARTGAEVLIPAGTGVALLGGGAGLVFFVRRRRNASNATGR
jgi:LPXTG-motif cell wall-anchored protein